MSARCILVAFSALALSTAAGAQELAGLSPFVPAGSGGGAVATDNAPLELRGIMGLGAGRMFNIYDPSTKSSTWVRQGEAGHPFTVRSADERSDSVVVDFGGRTLTLRLPEAKIAALSPMPVPTMSAQPARRGDPAAGPGASPGAPAAPRELTPEQAKQLENVAAEVARRRALRNAAQGNQPQSGAR